MQKTQQSSRYVSAPANSTNKRLRRTGGALLTIIVVTATAATWTVRGALAQVGLRLIVGGKTASTDIRMIGGHAYVPLADMARAMNCTVVKRKVDGNYEIALSGVGSPTEPFMGNGSGGAIAGGANEVHGPRGAVGQVLFNGKWRFSVLSVDHAVSYDSQFLPDKRTFAPAGDSQELVVVRCRMKNGQKETKMAMLSAIHPDHTALADTQGQSYPPMDYDKRGGHTDEGPDMLPGGQTEFAILFSVPKGTALQDLVFSVQNAYDDPKDGTDVRIALAH